MIKVDTEKGYCGRLPVARQTEIPEKSYTLELCVQPDTGDHMLGVGLTHRRLVS